jgi:hypothetical protein
MRKIILAVCTALLSVAGAGGQGPSVQPVSGQTPSVATDYVSVIYAMCDEAGAARFEFDYSGAEEMIRQALMVFESQSREFQEDGAELKGELYYDLTRYLALQDKTDEALDAFALAIDHGWSNHAFARADGDLDNIRREKRFRQMMRTIKIGKH